MKNKWRGVGLSLAVVGLLALLVGMRLTDSIPTTAPGLTLPGMFDFDRERDDGYFTIVDSQEQVLDKTIRMVYLGDELIAEDNWRYRVERVEGDIAHAVRVNKEQIAWSEDEDAEVLPVQAKGASNLIGIYHTHSAESYVPTEGTDSIPGEGGILKVGDVLANKLRELGLRVQHDKTPHEPRDSDAYRRSRRTAAKLLAEQPAVLIDLHRDGIPDPNFYEATVNGEQVTRMRLVVGRQNQNYNANMDFAKRLKAYTDEHIPGLIRSIFIARGNYNQDMAPRMVIIEAGTHTNPREQAERGVALFAEAMPKVMGVTAGAGPASKTTAGDVSSMWWMLGVLVAGVGGFLLLSTGSLGGARAQLKQFFTKEWTNYLGRWRKTTADSNDESFYTEEVEAERERIIAEDKRAENRKQPPRWPDDDRL